MWSREATVKEAQRKNAIRNRVCVVHLREGRTIPLVAEARKKAGLGPPLQSYPHPWTSKCRERSPAERKRRAALVAKAREAMAEEVEIINGRMAEDAK